METSVEITTKPRGRPRKPADELVKNRILVGLTAAEMEDAEAIAGAEFDSLAQHIRKYYLIGKKARNFTKEIKKKVGSHSKDPSIELSSVIAKANEEKNVS